MKRRGLSDPNALGLRSPGQEATRMPPPQGFLSWLPVLASCPASCRHSTSAERRVPCAGRFLRHGQHAFLLRKLEARRGQQPQSRTAGSRRRGADRGADCNGLG